MPDPISAGFLGAAYSFASLVWGYIKWPAKQIALAFRLNARVAELEEKLGRLSETPAAPSPFRKCPYCGERDMRMQDRYRFRHSPFDRERYFHEKWRCYSCGAMDEVNIPEPGG